MSMCRRCRFCELTSDRQGSSSAELARQVGRARQRQETRFAETDVRSNSRMNRRQVRQFFPPDDDGHNMLKQAVYELGLSARTHDKVLKVAQPSPTSKAETPLNRNTSPKPSNITASTETFSR